MALAEKRGNVFCAVVLFLGRAVARGPLNFSLVRIKGALLMRRGAGGRRLVHERTAGLE